MICKKIYTLIVEDDVIMGMEMREFIEDLGYSVLDTATCGRDAIHAAQMHPPDFVLMDIRLKGTLNGIEVAQRLRMFTQVPIIFLTGYKNNIITEQIHRIQNSFLITKPFDPEKLEKTIKSLTGND